MNRQEIQDLKDNPLPKSPYFTMPDAKFLSFPEKGPKEAPTVKTIWGKADKMTEKSKTSFFADLLRFCSIDFDAMARDKDIANGHQIKSRLNAILRQEGYKVEGNSVVVCEGPVVFTDEEIIREPDTDLDEQGTALSAIQGSSLEVEVDDTSSQVNDGSTTKSARSRKTREVMESGTPEDHGNKKQKKEVKVEEEGA